MLQKFSVPMTAAPEALIEKARQAALRSGGSFEGDARAGQFSGHGVQGYYSIGENAVEVTVTQKPIFLPWGLVENAIRGFFTA